MKIYHLTFGQLLKLGSSRNLCRLTLAYHRRLRQEWNREFPMYVDRFSVRHAEGRFPDIRSRYTPVLNFLRGPELKRATRLASAEQRIPVIPGAHREFVKIRFYGVPASQKNSFDMARLIVTFCESLGVTARVRIGKGFYTVHVDTDEFGLYVLRYHPGATLSSVRQYCEDGRAEFSQLFWWVPEATPGNIRLNPSSNCLNTPDYQQNAQDILFRVCGCDICNEKASR